MKIQKEERKVLSLQNVPLSQYDWLKHRAGDIGVTVSSLIKMLIQKEMEKQK